MERDRREALGGALELGQLGAMNGAEGHKDLRACATLVSLLTSALYPAPSFFSRLIPSVGDGQRLPDDPRLCLANDL